MKESSYQSLLAKVKRRLDKEKAEDPSVNMEMAIQALGETYLVVLVLQPWDYDREVYRVTPKGFELVYRNNVNTAASD